MVLPVPPVPITAIFLLIVALPFRGLKFMRLPGIPGGNCPYLIPKRHYDES